jgi:hypothetical protein
VVLWGPCSSEVEPAHVSRLDSGMTALTPERYRRILESNCGRLGGWIIEYEGRPFAELSDPQWLDMFWYSYAITFVSDDSALCEAARREPSFFDRPQVVWRSRQFGEVVPGAFVAGDGVRSLPYSSDGTRISVRALYLRVPDATTAWYWRLLDSFGVYDAYCACWQLAHHMKEAWRRHGA